MKKIVVCAAILALSASSAFAISASGDAGATILRQLEASQAGGEGIEFGDILHDGTGYDCLLDCGDSTPSASGTVCDGAQAQTTGNTDRAGKWTLTGTQNQGYLWTIPVSITVNLTGLDLVACGAGNSDMIIDDIDACELVDDAGGLLAGVAPAKTGSFNQDDTDENYIYGKLNVDADQCDGVYTGTYSITLVYS